MFTYILYLPFCDGGVPDDGCLVPEPLVYVPIHGVVAEGELPAGEPFHERRVGVVQDPVPLPLPDRVLRYPRPVLLGVLQGLVQLLVVAFTVVRSIISGIFRNN